MSRDVPTTRYFAVGYFTALQLEEKHRGMLARAAKSAAVSQIQSAVEAVFVTVFDIDTGIETVEMGIGKVGLAKQNLEQQAAGGSFEIERFNSSQFPGALTPEDAFAQYLASPEGILSFGTATAVQLFAVNVDAFKDLAKS